MINGVENLLPELSNVLIGKVNNPFDFVVIRSFLSILFNFIKNPHFNLI